MKKTRILKATETGDHWKGKTIPRILLQGKWLEEAGFPPGSTVRVTIQSDGVILISKNDLL